MRPLLASLLGLAITGAAQAEDITISATPIASFERLSGERRFGPFAWRGGLTLTSGSAGFGGLSGLAMAEGCKELLAVSDTGRWLQARLRYDGGMVSGIGGARLSPMRDGRGEGFGSKDAADAEALARLHDGRLLVAFERRVRFGRYAGTDSRFQPVPHPKDMDTGPENGEVEAAGELADGRLLAIAESQFDTAGDIRAWTWKGDRTIAFAITRRGSYRITDLAVLKDGSILTLERRFDSTSLPAVAVRRFASADIRAGAVIAPDLLLEASVPLSVIDNMEGMAACEQDGETRITLVSDDNFNPLQSTILLQFAYRP